MVDALDVEEMLRPCIAWATRAAESSGHQFTSNIDSGLPLIMADAEHIHDVVMRNLKNAFSFTPAGGSIALTAKATSEKKILICISDTGIGMSDEDLAVALTEFGQVDNSLDRESAGTGLGLPISKVLTELQGGTFIVKSEKGKGTNIVLLFDMLAPVNTLPAEGDNSHAQ